MTSNDVASKWLASKSFMLVIMMFLLGGVAMILWPRIEAKFDEQRQLAMLGEWSDQLQQRAIKNTGENPNTQLNPNPHKLTAEPNQNSLTDDSKLPQWEVVDGTELLGQLLIDRIDLQQPIVRGTSETALLQGAGTVVEDRLPGQIGNFALAGHRGRSYGRLFNRLGELEVGDRIEVDTTSGTYSYVIQSTMLVLPTEISVLDNEEGVASLTLITCHPVRNPTHRLIVKAVLTTN